MIVRVKLFAGAAAQAGRPELEITLPEHATVGDLRRQLGQVCPGLNLWPTHRIAVNQAYVTDEFVLAGDEEIAFIPPVSGG